VSGFEPALEVAAAHEYAAARRKAHEELLAAGTPPLDVEPADLPAAVVARYLEIKRARRL
jgi:hypothetical protein